MTDTAKTTGDAFVTADRDKLPAELKPLTDVTVPLLDGVQFFEGRVTTASIFAAAAWAIGIAFLALITIPLGVADLFHPSGPVTVTSHGDAYLLGFGLLCALIAWVMSSTAIHRLRRRWDQTAGRPTRGGVFLDRDTLFVANDGTFTVIPRSQFRGLNETNAQYQHGDAVKKATMPSEYVGVSSAEVGRAVKEWAEVAVDAE